MSTTLPLLSLSLSVHSYASGCKNSPFGGVGRGRRSGSELAPGKISRCSGSGHRANVRVKRRGTEARQPKGNQVDWSVGWSGGRGGAGHPAVLPSSVDGGLEAFRGRVSGGEVLDYQSD